jgi:hypothetical protein
MDIANPQDWAQGAGAIKTGVDVLRSLVGIIRDLKGAGAQTETEQKVVDKAIEEAEQAAKIADAQVAKALGYQLCHCAFPPTAMLTVGHHLSRGQTGPVYECPRCGYNTAGPFTFQRIAPPRSSATSA